MTVIYRSHMCENLTTSREATVDTRKTKVISVTYIYAYSVLLLYTGFLCLEFWQLNVVHHDYMLPALNNFLFRLYSYHAGTVPKLAFGRLAARVGAQTGLLRISHTGLASRLAQVRDGIGLDASFMAYTLTLWSANHNFIRIMALPQCHITTGVLYNMHTSLLQCTIIHSYT